MVEAVNGTKVNVRHDATVLLTLTGEQQDGTRYVLDAKTVRVAELNGAILLMEYLYKPLGVYGSGQWRHPGTGDPIRRPQYTYELTDPASQILSDGELCDCAECVPE